MTVATDALRILVVDDHRVFTDLLSHALSTDPSFVCVASAHGVAEAIDVAEHTPIDLAIVDVHLPDGDGIDLAARLLARYPHVRIILLTAFPRPGMVERARAVGASALLAKEGPLDALLAALRTARPDAPVLVDLPPPPTDLTPRELEVLRLLGQGNDSRTIARLLGISPHTSRDHIKSILAKLGCSSQLDAVVSASRAGLIEIGRR